MTMVRPKKSSGIEVLAGTQTASWIGLWIHMLQLSDEK